MTTKDGKPETASPEQPDPLSATGMFLRGFESRPDSGSTGADATFQDFFTKQPEKPQDATPLPPEQPTATAPRSGEFTQLFQSLTPAGQSPQPAPAVGPPEAAGPGEFTRIFNAGAGAPPASSGGISERSVAPAPPPSNATPRAKGFSSPGVSDSASAEGSFTQFFKSASAPPAGPAPASSPLVTPSAPRPPLEEIPWKREPAARPIEPSQAQASPSITTLLSSLSSTEPAPGRQAEPAPYRPEPLPETVFPPKPSEPAGLEAGGVTRLIQRLAQTPAEPAAPPPPPVQVAPPVSSGPGEFTRMISRIGGPSQDAPMAPPPPAPAPAAPVAFAPPPMPAPAMPPMAPPPMAAPAPAAVPPAAPAFAAPRIPAAPAPAPPAVALPAAAAFAKPPVPAPAPIPAPKSRLEAMVPVLLVINTFLLLALLLIQIFALKH